MVQQQIDDRMKPMMQQLVHMQTLFERFMTVPMVAPSSVEAQPSSPSSVLSPTLPIERTPKAESSPSEVPSPPRRTPPGVPARGRLVQQRAQTYESSISDGQHSFGPPRQREASRLPRSPRPVSPRRPVATHIKQKQDPATKPFAKRSPRDREKIRQQLEAAAASGAHGQPVSEAENEAGVVSADPYGEHRVHHGVSPLLFRIQQTIPCI